MDPKRYPELLSAIFAGLLIFFMVLPLERFSGSIFGHLLGIVGTLLMAATLTYVYKKRILKKKGKANPLNPHIYFGLIGGILVVVHAGSQSSSWIGILVYAAMLLTILSGIVGRVLFVKLNRSIKEKKSDIGLLEKSLKKMKQELNPVLCRRELSLRHIAEWAAEEAAAESEASVDTALYEQCTRFELLAESLAEREERLQVYAQTKTLFTFWNTIHMAATWFLFAMVVVHVLTTIHYGLRWLP